MRRLATAVAVLSVLGAGWASPAAAQCATPRFGPPTAFPAAAGTLAPADYDVDGHVDVAVGGVLLYGDGAGGFGPPVGVPGVRAISAVDLGGVNPPIPPVNNAAPELVAESTVSATRVVVGLGSGNRSAPFSLLAGFPVWGSPPLSSVAADLTGDGLPDLVIGYGPPANALVIWIGVGGGPNWLPQVAPVVLPFADPVGLAVGDFDDDGRLELLALSGSGNVLREYKYVNGQFLGEDLPVAGGPTGLAVADLDGDGLLDAVMTAGGEVVTVLGTGKVVGSLAYGPPFAGMRRVSVGGSLAGLALGDVNGDQRVDAVVVDRANRQVLPLLGDGAGGFTPTAPLPTGTAAPASVALADLDQSGTLDILTGDATDASVAVRLNTCPVSPVDVEVTGLEVTQGIQDTANSVLLVADRRTFVRVHVRAGAAVDGVTARLTRTDGAGTPLDRALWPDNPGGRIQVKASPDRKLLQDAFLFELPPSWTTAGTLHLEASVNPDHLPVETRYGNNTASRDVTFQSTNPLAIELIKVRYATGPGTTTDCSQALEATDTDLDEAESALRRQLPAARFVIARRADVWDSGLTMDCSINNAPGVEATVFRDALMDAYASAARDRIRVGIYRRQFNGGIVDSIPGWFAVAQYGAPQTVVHEVGHTLGRSHVASPATPPCSASLAPGGLDTLYPYPDGRIGGPASDPERFVGFDPGDASPGSWPIPRRVVPPTLGDTMSYCHDRWPSDYTWSGLRSGINARLPARNPVGDFLRVTGEIDPSTGAVRRLAAVRRPRVGAIDPASPGSFHLQLLDAAGGMLSDLAFSPRPDHDGQPTGIAETLGFVPGTRSLLVVDPAGVAIGALSVSAHPPVVTDLTLPAGPVLPASGPVTVRWSASDPDGDPLLADLLWSRDGGETFSPLASGISGTSYLLDAARLTGTGGRASGVLRVFVRDPVLSASSDAAGLTAAGSGPRVRIVAPSGGQVFVRGQTVSLQAIASDAEDGKLEGAVTWSSDRDGALGSGGTLALRLSLGSHVLTARVRDSDGNASSAATTVQVLGVLPPARPPVAVAGGDQRVAEGATVTLDGSGSHQPDGAPLTYAWRVVQAPSNVQGPALAGSGARATFVAPDDGTYRFELTVSDPRQVTATDTLTVTVANVAPSVSITSPADGAVLWTGPVRVEARFADPGPIDTHVCAVIWDEDTATPPVAGEVSETAHTCAASRVLRAGVYSVRVAVRDDDGGQGVARVRVVVVDPRAGSVSGAGALASPRGALTSDPRASGRATFELASAYRRWAIRPRGEVELRLGRFHFRSRVQDWLVVAGARAQLSGSGEVNGRPGFGYLITAYDDDPRRPCREEGREQGREREGEGRGSASSPRSGPGERDGRGKDPRRTLVDRLRLKVWSRATGAIVYDNVPGAPDDIDSASPAAIPDGCVAITR